MDELPDIKYDKIKMPARGEHEAEAGCFLICEMIKEARKDAKITQEELAQKTGIGKNYISRLENGKADIQLSTLFKIFSTGLGRQVKLTIV